MAYVWLGIWGVAQVMRQVRGESPWTWLAVDVGVLGFGFGIHLVLGVGRSVLSRLVSPAFIHPWALLEVPLASALAGATALQAVPGFQAWVVVIASVVGPLLGFFIVASFAISMRVRRVAAPPCGHGMADAWATRLALAAVAYAGLAGVLTAWQGALHPSSIHGWLVGLVATAIFAVSHRWLPRFRQRHPQRFWHDVQASAALPAPALMLAAMTFHAGWLHALAGASFLVAASVHVGLWLHCLRHRRNRHPVHFAMTAAGVFLLGGGLLGVAFQATPALSVWIPVHATVQLVGFILVTAFGAATVMVGTGDPPGWRRTRWAAAALPGVLAVFLVLLVVGNQMAFVAGVPLGVLVTFHALDGIRSLQ